MEALARRWKSALAKALLVLASLLVVFCVVECAVLPGVLVNPPHKYQSRFSLMMQVISQHSKSGLIPRDYLLLIGDSYAKGYGEWLNRADPEGNDPYHSAHVLHDRLERDVLSYGKGGAGSIPGLVLFPARWDRALARYDLEAPEVVAVYFYEGNDLNDNRRYLSRHFPGGPGSSDLMDDAAFERFLAEELESYLAKKAAVDATLTVPLVYKSARGVVETWWKNRGREPEPAASSGPDSEPEAPPEAISRARIAGEVVGLPFSLQSPALELSEQELAGALQVTRRCLALLAERYAGSELVLFRIPSPLSTYDIVSDEVHIQSYEQREALRATEQIARYADEIGRSLAADAAELGYRYVDLRPALQQAAREQILHGPKDWKHLNEAGYTVLGEAVARHVTSAAAEVTARPDPEVTR